MSADLLPAAVLVPVCAALVCVVVPAWLRRHVGLLGAIATGGAGLAVVTLVATTGAASTALGGRVPPLGIAMRADGAAAVFLLLASVVGLVVSLHAHAHPEDTGVPRARDWFWPAWLLAWAGLAAVFLSGDLFNLYVAIEVLSLSAVVLVTLGGRESLGPAFRYLTIAVAGSLLFLFAIGIVYAHVGTLDLALAGERFAADPDPMILSGVAGLTLAGMLLKSAVFPLHGWLPGAHGSAPVTVSPLLSGLVVKASFFIAYRVWSQVTGPVDGVGVAVGVLAVASLVWAGTVALRQKGFKQVVAYSTISQMGYLFLYFPLSAAAVGAGAAGDPDASDRVWAAAATFALAHGLAKAGLFLGAGVLRKRLGTDRLDQLATDGRGAATLTMAMTLAAVSLIGLPLTLGFTAKWQLLVAGATTQTWWVVVAIGVGSLLSAFYLVRPLQAIVAREKGGVDLHDGPIRTATVPIRMVLAPLTLALLCAIGAFWTEDIAELAVVDAPESAPTESAPTESAPSEVPE